MSWGGVQHEVFGAGGGDDAGRQEDVDDRLEEEKDLRLLQVRAICKGTIEKNSLGLFYEIYHDRHQP